jgi:hypothetical protein
MTKNLESKNIDQLLAEADELTRQINSGVVMDMEETHLLQLEKHAQNLKQMKTDAERKIKEKKASAIGSGAEGMHEAILDIVKAMKELKDYYSL